MTQPDPNTTHASPAARDQKVRRLGEILQSAKFHREQMESLAASACAITGEKIDTNSFAEEAVFDGCLTAEELLLSVEANRYVRL